MGSLPSIEKARLEALRRYAILDTPPDGTFDAITRLVCRELQVPIAIVSLVDEDRIWFKSHTGLELDQIPRDPGLCSSAILSDLPYVLTDARVDPRSLANPLVAGAFGLRFYAGVPLKTHDDHRLGVLCAIDHQPRQVTAAELSLLSDLASVVMDQMELRLSARRIHSLNLELEQAHAAAERASRAKGVFLAQMSHELRTPLSAVVGLSHLLRSDASAASRASRLDKMDAALRHVQGIIQEVLDLARIESGRDELDEADFDVEGLLLEVRAMVEDRAAAQGVAVRIEAPPPPARRHGDVGRLRQALLNYAGNAVKFTRAGSITLRARLLEEDAGAALLRFEVQDTGIGIAPQALAGLFEPFVQVREPHAPGAAGATGGAGTGLGLAITRALAQKMGGQAGADSVPGQGSLFWFTARLPPAASMPASSDAHDQVAAAEAALRARAAGHRVLVVDDEALHREVVRELLVQCGLQVDEAASGPEAARLALAQPYSVILSDLQLPGFDGIELARRVRARRPGGGPPIVALTGSAEAEMKQQCLDAGMNEVLAKPVEPAALFAALLAWLPPPSAAAWTMAPSNAPKPTPP
ncbi:MAG: response regulator [Proteobacteria bacterium]|nr:response regulator [Pseudomonadota bacterium]